jgi:hypothetical protein
MRRGLLDLSIVERPTTTVGANSGEKEEETGAAAKDGLDGCAEYERIWRDPP